MDIVELALTMRSIEQRYGVKFQLFAGGAIRLAPIVSNATAEAAELFADHQVAMSLVLRFDGDPHQLKRLKHAARMRNRWIAGEWAVAVGVGE